MQKQHKQYREGDEFVCSCGLRWDVREADPHFESTANKSKSRKRHIDLRNIGMIREQLNA